MTITLYEDTCFRGRSQCFAKNKANLKDTKVGNNPSSIKLSCRDDAVLLFKKKDWKGSVLFVRGPKQVSDLGKKDEGGKSGFKNGITSLRQTPFILNLNVRIFSNSRGRYPGSWTSSEDAENGVREAVELVNQFYERSRALLKLVVVFCRTQVSDHYFVVKRGGANYPPEWKRSNMVDVFFVHDFEKVGVAGRAKPPMFGETITIPALDDVKGGGTLVRCPGEFARSLAHELGHYLGIHHPSANDSKSNIMYHDGLGHKLSQRNLRPDQIEDMHTTLSKNIARKADRDE